MKKKTPRDYRNPVAEAAAYLTKPARHRDRKHDYERSPKHRGRAAEDSAVDAASSKRKREILARESEDWFSDLDEEWEDIYGLEPEEDTPPTGEVQ